MKVRSIKSGVTEEFLWPENAQPILPNIGDIYSSNTGGVTKVKGIAHKYSCAIKGQTIEQVLIEILVE